MLGEIKNIFLNWPLKSLDFKFDYLPNLILFVGYIKLRYYFPSFTDVKTKKQR